jgi:cytochrome P450
MAECPAFPMSREAEPLNPPPEYAWLRANQPVSKVRLWDGSTAWLVTRYEDVRKLLIDRRVSAVGADSRYPTLSPMRHELVRAERSFLFLDPPEHKRYRSMIVKEFTVRRCEELRPRIQRMVDDLLDQIAAKGPVVDFIAEFAALLPALVIFDMMGVPFEQHGFFQTRNYARANLKSTAEAARQAGQEMADTLGALVDEALATKSTADTMIARLAANYIAPGELSRDEAVMMSRLVLMGGHETTTNMIGLGVLSLLQHPAQLAELRADPALMPNAVEELLRFHTILQYTSSRFATEDIEVGGETIKAGDGIFALLTSANRDESVFACPNDIDIHSEAARKHVAFGFGVHQCIGQTLARVELECAFRSLLVRFPDLQLAVPENELPYRLEMNAWGLHALPLRLTGEADARAA